ncbi:hypothetical protein SAMN04489712_11481 [Thermomonospora echinospora]|uniref:VOC domain-containing protein n=1 Tax=Thermomonospora echinospora TaxID=1992 RepID=A0A1H6D9R6_9ACTN|nr:VOC family protein [Thermomonospora echinospora]SEG81543.1 hypothetical protein SAMN04489712_11481 [Thermomonospora echinospora]
MPEMTSYEPGEPCWADLASPDPEAAKVFYGGLFGWGSSTPADPGFGGYTSFTLGGVEGDEVAGLMELMDERQPPAWTCYISVADADETADAVTAAGGQVYTPPMDVAGLGRMAVFGDSQGAVFGVWEPGDFAGARRVNEPGALCWTELACRDIEAAKAFYGSVIGWESVTEPAGTTTYTEWTTDGRSIAGMVQMNEEWPDDAPPYWMPYFAVEDCDAAADKAVALGGRVPVPPTDIPPGRFAVVADPDGAYLSIIRLTG